MWYIMFLIKFTEIWIKFFKNLQVMRYFETLSFRILSSSEVDDK